jgi:hypothetical protein
MEFTRPLRFQFPLLRGDDVHAAQQALNTLAVSPPCGTPDGVFGQMTGETVSAFQQGWNVHAPAGAVRLNTDGVIDAPTWGALFEAAEARTASAVPASIAADIPLTRPQVIRLRQWMDKNFRAAIDAAIAGTPVTFELVCAIAAKETACRWINFVDRIAPADLLPLCVFDATGDCPGTEHRRLAFPVNAAALRADPVGGDALTDMLIDEANKMRKVLNGWGPERYLYKGYGLFQYDLQNIRIDKPFFAEKQWYEFDKCLDRFMRVMRDKLAEQKGDVDKAVAAYNGQGEAAVRYRESVLVMRDWSAAVA